MASCFFLLKQFDDVLIYLNSIKDYFYRDDNFNYNFGQALYGNCDIVFETGSHAFSQLHVTPHESCAVFYVMPIVGS